MFKRDSPNELTRRVVMQRNYDVYSGLVKFGDDELGPADAQPALERLASKFRTLALWCKRADLPADSVSAGAVIVG